MTQTTSSHLDSILEELTNINGDCYRQRHFNHLHTSTFILPKPSSLKHPLFPHPLIPHPNLLMNAVPAHSTLHFFPFLYCINIRLTKKRHHLFGSVRSPSVLFWPRVQHRECLLALTSTRVENKHLARQRSINNTPSLCCPLVSAAAAFCYFAVLLSLSFVVLKCVCVCVQECMCVYKML